MAADALGKDGAVVVYGDSAAVVAGSTLAADRHGGDHGTRRLVDRVGQHADGAYGASTVAAAAADALRENAGGCRALHRDRAVIGDVDDVAVAADPAVAADARADVQCLRSLVLATARLAELRRDRHAAVAATAADALCLDPVPAQPVGQDRAKHVVGDIDLAAVIAIARAAADGYADGRGILGRAGHLGCDRHPAIAARATDALRQDAHGIEAPGCNRAIVVDRNSVGDAPGSACTADRDADRTGRLGEGQRSGHRHAAITAAAANALRHHADGVVAIGRDTPGGSSR